MSVKKYGLLLQPLVAAAKHLNRLKASPTAPSRISTMKKMLLRHWMLTKLVANHLNVSRGVPPASLCRSMACCFSRWLILQSTCKHRASAMGVARLALADSIVAFLKRLPAKVVPWALEQLSGTTGVVYDLCNFGAKVRLRRQLLTTCSGCVQGITFTPKSEAVCGDPSHRLLCSACSCCSPECGLLARSKAFPACPCGATKTLQS